MIEEKQTFGSINSVFDRFVTAGLGMFCERIDLHMPQGLKYSNT